MDQAAVPSASARHQTKPIETPSPVTAAGTTQGRKIRSDSKLEQLSPAQRERLRYWLEDENRPYYTVADLVRNEFGVNVGKSAVALYWQRHVLPQRQQHKREFAATIAAMPVGDIAAATLNQVRMLAWEELTDQFPQTDRVARLLAMLHRAERLALAQQRVALEERRVALREAEADTPSLPSRSGSASKRRTPPPSPEPSASARHQTPQPPEPQALSKSCFDDASKGKPCLDDVSSRVPSQEIRQEPPVEPILPVQEAEELPSEPGVRPRDLAPQVVSESWPERRLEWNARLAWHAVRAGAPQRFPDLIAPPSNAAPSGASLTSIPHHPVPSASAGGQTPGPQQQAPTISSTNPPRYPSYSGLFRLTATAKLTLVHPNPAPSQTLSKPSSDSASNGPPAPRFSLMPTV